MCHDGKGAKLSRRLYFKQRSIQRIVACAALAGLLTFGASNVATARTSARVYFFSDNSKPIGPGNPLVMRPSGFPLFLDGQWLLQHLHWRDWGSPVARATGISNSATGSPSAAQSPRIKTWADVTLSDPVRWRGHMVYSCFKILVPPPASDLSGCVLPQVPIGNGWLAGNGTQVEFLAPGQRIWCGIDSVTAFCAGYPGGQSLRGVPTLGATLTRGGIVSICSTSSVQGGCAQNWDATPPVLQVGQRVRADNVLCQSESRGIACTIASGGKAGKGFLINSTAVRKLP
jgi:hypothetical protein